MTCSCCCGSSSTLSVVVNVASPSVATLRSRLSGRRLSHCTQKSLADRFITHWSGCHLGLRCAQQPCSILTSKTAQVECEGVPAIRTDRETKLSCNNPRQSGQQCPTTTRVSRAPQWGTLTRTKTGKRACPMMDLLCILPWVLERMLTKESGAAQEQVQEEMEEEREQG